VATAETARGFVSTGGTIYRFGRDRGGVHRAWALRDADPAIHPGPGAFCANEQRAGAMRAHPGRIAVAPDTQAAPPVASFSPTLLAQVAIETDQELLTQFYGNTTATLQYLADLAAAVSAIYDADTDVRVKFSFIRLWSTIDPWTASASDLDGLLSQFRNYWMTNEAGTPRDVAHFISGKTVAGGIAYVDVLCDPDFGYGVSEVYGAFDVMDPDETWDVMVVAHELGHNFGSDHTHCYNPPIDHCYASEPGCYNGPTSLPPGGGTIMSYCHLLSGGQSNINLTFGPTVSAVLRTGAENGSCIGLPCGDGILDPGEDCDDGNTVNGDCCAANCSAEPDGGACDDGETCTTSDQCAAGACVGTGGHGRHALRGRQPLHRRHLSGGACVGTPAPAPDCKLPTLPLKSQILLRNKVPDEATRSRGSGRRATRPRSPSSAIRRRPTTTSSASTGRSLAALQGPPSRPAAPASPVRAGRHSWAEATSTRIATALPPAWRS
jgi:cysteine-rich repeat protein